MCCYEITDNNILMKKCKHVFTICNDCNNKLNNINGQHKCPYCNCYTDMEKIYFMY